MNNTDFQHDIIETPGIGPEGEQRDVTMPLGTSDFGGSGVPGLDPLGGGAARKRISGTAILIPAVLVIAIGGLFLMNRVARVAAATSASGDYEKAVADFLDRFSNDGSTEDFTSTILSLEDNPDLVVLSESYSEHQVPLRDVQRDPFVIFESVAVPVEPGDMTANDAAETERRWRQERASRELAIEQAGTQLTLSSILGGSNPLAIVNGTIVRVGEEVLTRDETVTFVVKSISTSSVELIAEVPHLELSITTTVYIDRD